MAELHPDPVVELVRQAMASALLAFLEDYAESVRKLQAADPKQGVHLAFTEEAEEFVRIRTDLVGAVTCTLCPHPEHYDHNQER